MSASPFGSGRVPSNHISPRVGGGQSIKPSHINKLSEAVDRSAISGGKGIRVSKTPLSTSIVIPEKTNLSSVSWYARRADEKIVFNVGKFFYGDGDSNGNSQNQWFSNKFYNWSATRYYENPTTDGEHMQGAEIFFDLPEANYLTNTQIKNGSIPLECKLQQGLYYIEVSAWSGKQMTNPFAGVENKTDNMNDFINELPEWNSHSQEMSGENVPILKYAPKDKMKTLGNAVYPICTVDQDGFVFRGITTDIFANSSSNKHPYKLTVYKYDDTWYIDVAFGTVNNKIPTYEDGYEVGDFDGGIEIGSGNTLSETTHNVILQLDYVEEEPFPSPPSTVFASEEDVEDNTDDTGYVLIGRVTVAMEGQGQEARPVFDIEQAVTGSLWVERFKCGKEDALYWTTRI